jgi:hypothetical protein
MQAFWIQTTADGATFTVPNSARLMNPPPSDDPNAKPFYRVAATSAKTLQFSAYLKNEEGAIKDETIIRFGKPAKEDFDPEFDAYKFKNDKNCPSLYTVLDNEQFAINSLPADFLHKTIPLYFEAQNAGQYKLDLDRMEGFDETYSIYLYDNLKGTLQDLQLEPSYDFDYNKGDLPDRFYINIVNAITSTTEAENALIHINTQGHEAHIVFENVKADDASIYVYTAMGQQLHGSDHVNISSGTYPLHFTKNETGIFIIKVVTSERTFTKKVYIK